MTLDAHPVLPWTLDEIHLVLAAFGIGALVGQPMPDVGWDVQRAPCRLQTNSGAWFLKKHRPAVVRRESHAVMEAFRRLGGCAPDFMAQPDGKTWLERDAWAAEVHRIIPGQPVGKPSDAEALEAIELVAHLHRVPVSLVPEGRAGWYDSSEAQQLGSYVTGKLKAYGLRTDGLERCIAAEADGVRGEADSPPVVVHGDLWRGNWLTRGGHIVALTDFDYVRRGERIEDLADVLLAMCSDRDTGPGDAPLVPAGQSLVQGRFVAMLRRYEEMSGALTNAERERLPSRQRSMWVRHVLYALRASEDAVHLRAVLDRTVRFCPTVASLL